jgi:16S rRNA C967 or C1407 C5-methylase (RsmB/RsmF family)
MESLFFGSQQSLRLQNLTRTAKRTKPIFTKLNFLQIQFQSTNRFSTIRVVIIAPRQTDQEILVLGNIQAEFRLEVVKSFIEYFGESHWQAIAKALTIPPAWTCIRLNSLHKEETYRKLENIVNDFNKTRLSKCKLSKHPILMDCVCLDFAKNDDTNKEYLRDYNNLHRVVVDTKCGEAVLRGADVFAPGVKGCSVGLMEGDNCAVFVDLDSQVLHGEKNVTTDSLVGDVRLLFVGVGVATQSRSKILVEERSGCAIRMIQRPTGDSPSLNQVLSGEIFLQNLPSALVAVVLDPKPGELVHDMCSSPGGKTSHIADRMNYSGLLVACDRTTAKCKPVMDCCDLFRPERAPQFLFVCQSDSAKSYSDLRDHSNASFVTRKQLLETHLSALKKDETSGVWILPGGSLPLGVFDKILLDGPCSSLGLRPRFSHIDMTNKLLEEMSKVQKRMLFNAMNLVKQGGHIVYSTCTFNPGENEHIVKWAIDKYPHVLKLVPAEPRLGGFGLGKILGEELSKLVLRFDPSDTTTVDSIGFFIAKFEKIGQVTSNDLFGY